MSWDELTYLLFSVEGRISRRTYWKCIASLLLGSFLIFFVVVSIWPALHRPKAFVLAVAALYLFYILVNIAVGVKRLHDIGLSGAWISVGFTCFIPHWGALFGLIVFCGYLVLGFVPGVRGPNGYGSDPLEGANGSSVRVDPEVAREYPPESPGL